MASGVWSMAMAEIARGDITLLTDDIRALLVNDSFTPNFALDQNLDDIVSGNRIGDAIALTSPTIADTGIFDAANTTITSVAGSLTVSNIAVYYHSGVEATATLIAWHDVASPLATDVPASRPPSQA